MALFLIEPEAIINRTNHKPNWWFQFFRPNRWKPSRWFQFLNRTNPNRIDPNRTDKTPDHMALIMMWHTHTGWCFCLQEAILPSFYEQILCQLIYVLAHFAECTAYKLGVTASSMHYQSLVQFCWWNWMESFCAKHCLLAHCALCQRVGEIDPRRGRSTREAQSW